MQDSPNNSFKSNGRWTKEEHQKFLQGLRIYGKNWKKIQALIQTRNGCQIRSHAQKFFLKMKPTEAVEFNQSSSPNGELLEDAEQPTLNSKSSSQWPLAREDFSFYLAKIMQYSNEGSKLDFWSVLVDCKKITDNLNLQNRHGSFSSVEKGGFCAESLSRLNNKVFI